MIEIMDDEQPDRQQEINGGYQGLVHEVELLDQERHEEQEGPA